MLDRGSPAAAVTQSGEHHESRSLGLHLIRLTGEATGGAVTVWEEIVEPGWGPPPHVHHREDETFHLLAGRMRFRCGEEEFEAGPGATVFLPRGVPHAFVNVGIDVARMLVVCTPGGFDGFFRDLDALGEFGPDEIAAAAECYGLEFLPN